MMGTDRDNAGHLSPGVLEGGGLMGDRQGHTPLGVSCPVPVPEYPTPKQMRPGSQALLPGMASQSLTGSTSGPAAQRSNTVS